MSPLDIAVATDPSAAKSCEDVPSDFTNIGDVIFP